MCVIANVQSLVSLPDSENMSVLLQTEGEENIHVENNNKHGTEQPAKEDLNVDNSSVLPGSDADNGEYPHNEDGAEVQGSNHLDVNSVLPQSTENLPGSDADKGKYLPNEHGTEQPAKEDLDVDNNSVLPTTSGDNGESSPNRDGTQSHVTEHINVENNSVLPQAEGHWGELPPTK